MKDLPELITVEQAAAYLQVAPVTVYRMLDAGKLPAAKVGRMWRIRKTDVDKFIRRQTIKKECQPGDGQ